MAESEAQRVSVVCKVDDLSTTGWVLRRDLSRSERAKRGGKIFGCFFLVACLTVFIPILHFILPPLLLLTGSILGFGEYTGTGEILSGEITCPNCKKLMILRPEGEVWPRPQRCEGCSFSLMVEKV